MRQIKDFSINDSINPQRQSILESCDQNGSTHFHHTHPNIFNKLLIWVNLYQHKKNEAISSFCSRYIFDLKILQYYWPRAFWHKSQERDFSQIWNLSNNIAYNVNFHYRPHSGKSNDEINKKNWPKKLIQFRENDWKEGRMDGQTLPLTPGIQKISVVLQLFFIDRYILQF